MRDIWYGDKRDVVKWGVLLELARKYRCRQILQVLYFRADQRAPKLQIGEELVNLPVEVLKHFRDVNAITGMKCEPEVRLVLHEYHHFGGYLRELTAEIGKLGPDAAIVFLDPDTGLEPRSGGNFRHVRTCDLERIWNLLRSGDLLVLYQHRGRTEEKKWFEPNKTRFAEAIRIPSQQIGCAYAPEIAVDVAFYFVRRD